jgi:PAS domain S-box-containing protein
MNLRYHIFIFITVLGLLPLAILLATSLPQGLRQLDNAAQQETIARAQSRHTKLVARVTGLKKSITRLAAVPAASDLTRYPTTINHDRIIHLSRDWFKDDTQIIAIQVVDAIGNELLHMSRQEGRFIPRDRSSLVTIEQSPPFLHGTQLYKDAVFVGITKQAEPANLSQPHTLFLVAPIVNGQDMTLGMTILTVDLGSFLQDFTDSLWLAPDLSPLNTIPDFQSFSTPPELTDRSRINADIIITESPGSINKMGWLPLSFNPDHRPILWIASPVDMSGSARWKQAITRNIIIIVAITGFVVFTLAHFIASHVLKIKTEIVRGLQHILHGETAFQFSWSGPQELQHLARDLTNVGENYVTAQAERQQAETALHESEENFRCLTSAALDGIIMMNKQGDITFWNKAAETFFGYSATEAIGQPIHALVDPKRLETGEDLFDKGTDTTYHDIIPLHATRKDGSEIQLELSLSAASLSDQWHAIWIIRDITERIHNEEKNRIQQQQLIQADKMISLGLLVAGVAHEINNPNSIILLNTPHLRRSWQSALPILEEFYADNGDFQMGGLEYTEMKTRIPKLIADIEEGGLRIKQIVSDLKDYAKQDTGHRLTAISINDVARAAIRLTHNKVKNSTHHFNIKLADNLPQFSGNSQRLEQVVINLINNSCESLTDMDKGITITSSFDSIKNLVKLTVQDEGTGINPQSLTKITDPFYTSKRSLGGTGLGLSVSAGIIEEHHGLLHFDSKVGVGTSASIIFKPLGNNT